jgi:hypothetical protein
MNRRSPSGRDSGAARFAPPPPPPPRRSRSRLSAVGAAVVLIALVAGVPALLVTLAGPVSLPTTWPDRASLTGSIGIEQVLTVLVVVAWLAWLQFVLCVLVEVVAALRGGVLARPVPLSGPSQRLARALVASVLLAGAVVGQMGAAQAAVTGPQTGRAVAAAPYAASAGDDVIVFSGETAMQHVSARSAARPVTARQAAAAQAAARRSVVGSTTAASPERGAPGGISDDEAALDGRKVYEVKAPAGRQHDSLWAIAERHLGDGRRYQEIFVLNEGRPQPDGRTLHLARLIQPGWLLIMPEDAAGVPRYVARRTETPAPAPPAQPAPRAAAPQSAPPSAPQARPGHAAHPERDARAGAAVGAEAARASVAQERAAQQRAAQQKAEREQAAQRQAEQESLARDAAAQAAARQAVKTGTGTVFRAASEAAQAEAAKAAAAKRAAAPPPAAAPVPPVSPVSPATPAAPAVPRAAPPAVPRSVPPASGVGIPPDADTPPQGNAIVTGRPSATRPATARPAATRPAALRPSERVEGVRSPAATDPAGDRRLVAIELAGAGLLAAALLGTLLAVRRRRQGGEAPGPESVDTEVWLRAGADADRGALLDLALRSLPRSCAGAGRPLPQAYGAVVDDDGLDLLLTMSHPSPPPPWTTTDDGLRWRLTYEDAQHLVADGDSAYPLLASVGRDPQGRDALINLGAAAGPVAVVGSPAMAAAVVRALALGLAGNPWSRGIEVLTSDLPPALPAIAAGRLVPCAGARDLTDQLEQGSGRMPRTGPIQILTGGPAPGSRPERVAVYGAPLNAPTAGRLQAVVGRRADLAVLVTGELPGARWRLKVDDAGNLSCDELGLSVTANRLGDGSIERLHALFMSASTVGPRPGLVTEPGDPGEPGEPIVETDDVTWAQAPVRVAILGQVEVRAPGIIDPGRLALAGEIVAYLALHPSGVHPTVLASAIWPRGVTADVRDGTLAQVRSWLGTDPDGSLRLREGHDGRIRLSPEVPCDWDVLRTLLARASQSHDPSRERDLLVRALHLVRGPVIGGITHGTYTWLPRTDLEHRSEELIVEAADRLSAICLAEGDQVAVGRAAGAGLLAAPAAQHLWRHILRAEHALGGNARLAAAVEHMRFALTTSGVDLEPETQALIDHLAGVPASSHPI